MLSQRSFSGALQVEEERILRKDHTEPTFAGGAQLVTCRGQIKTSQPRGLWGDYCFYPYRHFSYQLWGHSLPSSLRFGWG